MNSNFKVCVYFDIDKFHDSTDVLLPILWVLECSFPFGVSQFSKNKSKLPIFNNSEAHFSVGKITYWVGNFGQWAGLIY